jgi:hypothetical protein
MGYNWIPTCSTAPPQNNFPKQQFSAFFAAVYSVRMSMMPRYAKPNGVLSARSWKMRLPSSAAAEPLSRV